MLQVEFGSRFLHIQVRGQVKTVNSRGAGCVVVRISWAGGVLRPSVMHVEAFDEFRECVTTSELAHYVY
jgi:hypothetical protein